MIRKIKLPEKLFFGTRREDGKRAVEIIKKNSRRPTRKMKKLSEIPEFSFNQFLL